MGHWLALGILGLLITLLVSNRVRLDVAGLTVLTLVAIFRLVPVTDLFSGFSSYAALVIAAMFALGEGLRQSGAIDLLSSLFVQISRRGEKPLTTALLSLPPIPSAFISDVGLMGVFLPVIVQLHHRLRIPIHRLLVPIALSIALGGLLSMVGSAGNIIANATLTKDSIRPLGIFSITPLGLVLLGAGILFIRFGGIDRLGALPQAGHTPRSTADLVDVTVRPNTPLVGPTRQDPPHSAWTTERISNPGSTGLEPGHTLQSGNRSLLRGSAEATAGGLGASGPTQTMKAVVPAGSVLVGQTLPEVAFGSSDGLTILGILRPDPAAHTLRDFVQAGDILLVQGTYDSLRHPDRTRDLVVLDERRPTPGTPAFVAIAIVLGVLIASATNLVPLQAAAAAGILLMVQAGILSIDHAYRAIDWRIIVLIGGISPLSLALTRDGDTAVAAHLLATWVGPLGHLAMLSVFFWLAALLTQVVSNVAAALVLSPLAVSIAVTQHVSPYPLVVAMMVALSAAPLTPMANKVFVMAMAAGGYRYRDFFRIGLPLTFVMFTLVLLLVPVLFPFSR